MNEKVEKAIARFNKDLLPRYWDDWLILKKEIERLREVERKQNADSSL